MDTRAKPNRLFTAKSRSSAGVLDYDRNTSADQTLAFIVQSSHDAIISKDLNGLVTSWNRGAERLLGYSADEIVGRPVTIFIPPDKRDEDDTIFERLLRGELIEPFETVRTRKDGSVVDVLLTASPIWNAHGRVIGISKIAREITEFKRARDHQALLLGEMKHRVNNLVTVLEALGRGAIPKGEIVTEAFFGTFMGRVRALLSVGEMVIASSTRHADLGETANRALKPFVEVHKGQFRIVGPPLLLSEKTVGGLALAFHELATNALKYGALAVPDGKIDLSWTINQPTVTVVWKEEMSTGPSAPKSRGFGSRLIKAAVSAERNGKAKMRFEADGLRCVFEFDISP
ncbi:MAG TPA: PAS domain S-box protein [Rhizomicrobium sp.]|jgi:PAS domain S-box-containing protein